MSWKELIEKTEKEIEELLNDETLSIEEADLKYKKLKERLERYKKADDIIKEP